MGKIGSEEKTVVKNFGYLSLLQVAGYLFPLITMPYLARVVGASGFGKIAFASAIISWIQTVADWGFNYSATRDVAQHRSSCSDVSRIFSDVLWARCLLTLLSFLLLLVFVTLIPSFREHSTIIFVTFLMVPGHIFFPDWFFQAIERMKYTTLFNLLIKSIFTIAVFLFIKKPEDYILQPLFTSIGYILCGLISLWLILKKWGYKLLRPDFGRIMRVIKDSTDVFLNNLMPNFYNSLSVLILGSVCGSTATGVFDGGNKFLTVTHQFQSIISRAFFPYLSRNVDKHYLYKIINVGTGVVLAFLLFLFSPIIIKVMLGAEFVESIIVLRILAVSLVFMSLSSTYGTNYLIIVHREKELRQITLFASVIGMLVSYPLIKHYSYIGASLTILISRALIGVLSYYCVKSKKNGV